MLDYILAYMNYGADEEGQTMAEYAVVLAVITVGIIFALGVLSDGIGDALTRIAGTITGSSGG